MKRRTEIQVGMTVLVALVTMIWGVSWLKDISLHKKVRTWHVRFPQTGGLGASDEVQVNGIRKGVVSGIALVGDHVIVDLDLSSDVLPTTDSRVAIRNVGMMGEKVIAVDLTTTGNPYTARDTIMGVYEKGMGEVMAAMGTTVDAVSDLAEQLRNVADSMKKSGNLDVTLKNFRETSEELQSAVSENRAMLRTTMQNFAASSTTVKELTTDRQAQFKRTLDSFERSANNMEHLTSRMDSLRISLQSVTTKMDRGDGSLAKLINDDKLYEDAKASVKSLKDVLEDLKKNPKKYINLSIF